MRPVFATRFQWVEYLHPGGELNGVNPRLRPLSEIRLL